MSWLQDYIGRPWREDARGPEAYDCGGLVCAVQRAVWGRAVPALESPRSTMRPSALRPALGGWQHCPLPDAAEGDILMLRSTKGPHVGVFIRHMRRLAVLHAHGRIVRGRQCGRVCVSSMDELIGGGYSRPQAWRHCA